MTTAKIFMSGNSQAVRLPKEFRFDTDEVELTREVDGVMMRPKRKGLAHVLDIIAQMPEDMFVDIQDRRPPETRGDF